MGPYLPPIWPSGFAIFSPPSGHHHRRILTKTVNYTKTITDDHDHSMQPLPRRDPELGRAHHDALSATYRRGIMPPPLLTTIGKFKLT